jgi:tripartite-type tricarboxylate transporter receptor subunit TctC
LADISTFAEAGFGAYPGGPIYWGVVVPAGTPTPIVTRLHDELLGIFQSTKFADFAGKNFLETAAGSTNDFVAFLKKDRQSAAVLVDKYMK